MNSDTLEEVVGGLLSIAPLIRRNIQRKVMRTAFAQVEEDITLPHLEVLLALKEEGTRHIAAIGQRLQIPKPQMTPIIDRLEELGLVARQADAADRRTTNIALTDKGRRVIVGLDGVIKSGIREKLACLTDAELKELSTSLRKLGAILSKLP